MLPKSYTLNGAIYIIKASSINNVNLYSDKSFAYIMEKENSVDIDNEIDFMTAELLLQNR